MSQDRRRDASRKNETPESDARDLTKEQELAAETHFDSGSRKRPKDEPEG